MPSLELVIASLRWEGWQECTRTWWENSDGLIEKTRIIFGMPIMEAYQNGYEHSSPDAVLGFVHDDCKVHEKGWDSRVMREFEDSAVGLVCFGGALRHGTDDLYTSPYKLDNLGRRHFRSNLRNAEDHGLRFSGQCDVAVADGFAMFIRRDVLAKIGGWPMEAGYFMYAEAICCEARRQGYRIRLVGVDCEHIGGRSASMAKVQDDHAAAHLWLYQQYKDVLPYRVP